MCITIILYLIILKIAKLIYHINQTTNEMYHIAIIIHQAVYYIILSLISVSQ